MPLNTFNLPGKNVPADKQLAMMRNYLENLKDDIESDLYNIDWNNFSKPLREKLEGLDKELIAQGDVINSIQANYVSTQYLESEFIYTKSLDASQITSGRISTDHLDASVINTGNINSYAISTSYLDVYGKIKTSQLQASVITTGNIYSYAISTSYLDVNGKIKTNELDATVITSETINTSTIYCDQITVRNGSKINGDKLTQINANTITTGTIDAARIATDSLVFNGLKYTNGSWTLTLTLQHCQKYGGGSVWCLGTEQTP